MRRVTSVTMILKWGSLVQAVYTLLAIYYLGVSDGFLHRCGYIIPESPVILSIGSNFTAFCILNDPCPHYGRIHADQVIWKTKHAVVPKEQYIIVNQTVSSVTFNDTSTLISPLTCNILVPGDIVQNIYGIQIFLGLPPEKPTNLSCIVIQTEVTEFIQQCSWEPGRDTFLSTNYSLKSRWPNKVFPDCIPKEASNSCTKAGFVVFFVTLEVWVEAKNELGTVESDHLEFDPISCVKPLPPHKLSLNSGEFSRILKLKWENQFNESPEGLKYNIQYKTFDSNGWTETPLEDTASLRTSFTIQELRPNTKYVVRLCCAVSYSEYWSNWSEVVGFTAEDIPSKGPALWRKITTSDSQNWTLLLTWKELSPSEANGIIWKYEVSISGRPPVSFPTRFYTLNTTELVLNVQNGTYDVSITAYNKVGKSPTTLLLIPATNTKAPVKNIAAFPAAGKLWVNWTAPKESVNKYIIEWYEVCDNLNCTLEWQQEPGTKQGTFLKGNIRPHKCYIITVYPLYMGGQGEGRSVQAYLQQGVPASGPTVRTKKVGKSEAILEWKPLPTEDQNGFIKNYTVSYKTLTGEETVVAVDPSKTEFLLSSLSSDTLYMVQMTAYTESGGASGPLFTFTTSRFGEGEIEAIVVPVCLAFLLFTLLGVLFCFNKRETIRKHIWPNVPDPSKSVIAQWSPQTPAKHFNSKEHMYPEGSFTDVSVVELEADDKKSLSEQDLKPFDLLRKEKNASEGHSSGIGGSSCMSSPRQSVSDTDEGEPAQSTSSTVQYSTVIPNGYRDQTPPVQVFARSESTQPLLEMEEKPEDQQGLGNDNSLPRHRYFKQNGSWDETATEGSCLEKGKQISSISEEDPAGFQGSQLGGSGPDPEEKGTVLVGTFAPSSVEQTLQFENSRIDTVANEEIPKSYLPQTVREGGYMPQ